MDRNVAVLVCRIQQMKRTFYANSAGNNCRCGKPKLVPSGCHEFSPTQKQVDISQLFMLPYERKQCRHGE
jgi:hypothetical protein